MNSALEITVMVYLTHVKLYNICFFFTSSLKSDFSGFSVLVSDNRQIMVSKESHSEKKKKKKNSLNRYWMAQIIQ